VVVRRWGAETLTALAAALLRTRAGQPTVLLVQGEPGAGKSALLDELMSQAADFQHLRSEGFETGTATGYGVLAGWGVDLTPTQGSDTLSPVLAAQRLRAVVDAAAARGPVLLALDDLQWADPESVDAVIELLRRAAGDRLLLAVATRPQAVTDQSGWQQFLARQEAAVRLELAGLTQADGVALVQELRSDIDSGTATALWEHTSGNPLYLQSLLLEYEPGQLAGMQVLPAPAAFTQSVVARLTRLPEETVRLARAVAVLGSGWSSVFDIAELAQAEHPAAALQQLADAGLLELGRTGPTDSVKPAHALVRSAIYQHAPMETRRALHAGAAKLVTGRTAVLDHRVAAAERYDDELAADLETYALDLHLKRSYRLAAHYWATASAVSRQPSERERRWLESYFDTVLSGDRATVHAALDEIRQAADPVHSALVDGILAIWERRPVEGVETLTGAAERMEQPGIDPTTRYRIAVLLAWGGLQAGGSEQLIQAALERAAGAPAPDPALRGLELMATGQLISRTKSLDEVLAAVSFLPENPAAVSLPLTPALAWRGSVRSSVGHFNAGIGDLTEVTDRIQKGHADINGGSMHAMLGRAQWFRGQWSLARVSLRIADEMARGYPHPFAVASTPLAAVCDAAFDAADDGLKVAHEMLGRTPWVEAVDMLTVTEVIRFHAQGGAPAEIYERVRPVVRAIRAGDARKHAVWLLHAGLAALWANELGDAAMCAELVKAAPSNVSWQEAAGEWLFGLVAEARGKGKIALGHLRASLTAANLELPLYRAHALLDHARLAHLLGDTSASARSLDQAAEAYQSLGAGAYQRRVDELRRAGQAKVAEPTIALSDRERDVLTLAAEGLSYAQIARDLFITQSTVSYHLGNIYAKANVGSRHQLTDLVHADPAAFGLTALRTA
jgi:DNA-binding CsgD family transcriptional regulator